VHVHTARFGRIEVEEDRVITFPRGIYGFEHCRRFFLHREPFRGRPVEAWLAWLQSVEDGDVAFLVMDPAVAFPTYRPAVPKADLETVGLAAQADGALLVIAVVPPDTRDITVNLRAPLLVNPAERLGVQVILEDDAYPLRQPLSSAMSKGQARMIG